jgi:two-component system NtrC family sensor kinase
VIFTLYEQLVPNLPDGITVQDRNFKIIYQNNAMKHAFGCHIGAKCHTIYERRDQICEKCGVQKAFQTGEPNMVLRTAFGVDGTTSYWENSCFPLFDSEGNIIAGVEVCRNITGRVSLEEEVKDRNIELGQINRKLNQKTTQLQLALAERKEAEQKLRDEIKERKWAEKELQRSHDELKLILKKLEETQVQMLQSEKMASIGQLAAGIAHEINNPAAFVSSNLITLEEYRKDIFSLFQQYREIVSDLKEAGANPQSLSDLSNKIRRIDALEQETDLDFIIDDIESLITESQDGTKRIGKIVADLKDFAHPGEDKTKVANINQCLESTMNVVWNELKYKAKITKDYGDLPEVLCYPQQLNQVFMNILVNAAQAIEKEGEIRIATGAADGHVEISISDTGSGIPDEIISRVFEPFFTTKEVGKGTGLGLNIAYNIVNKHNGTISIESEIGKGTTFIIRIPVNGIDEK